MESFNAIDQEKKINELCDEQVAKINSKLSTLSKYANYCYELLEEISITESNYKDALNQLEKSRMEMLAKTKRGEYISYPSREISATIGVLCGRSYPVYTSS